MNRQIYTITVIFCCIISSTCFAQNDKKSDDSNNTAKPVNIKITEDTEFSIDDFVKGCIIMPSNMIKAGLLRFNGAVVIFKDTLTQKTERYGTKEIEGFTAQVDTSKVHKFSHAVVAGMFYKVTSAKKRFDTNIPVDTFKVNKDTFIVKAVPGRSAFGDKIVRDYKFVKQLIYGEKVCLYKTTQKNGNGSSAMANGHVMIVGNNYYCNFFYFKRKNEIKYTEIPQGKRAFKKLMAVYLKDDSQLVKAINNDEYGFDQLEQLTMIYNQDKVLN